MNYFSFKLFVVTEITNNYKAILTFCLHCSTHIWVCRMSFHGDNVESMAMDMEWVGDVKCFALID